MQDNLFIRKFSVHGTPVVNGELYAFMREDRFRDILIDLTKSYYQGKMIADHTSGDTRQIEYLIQGGILRVNTIRDFPKTLELISESAQGLSCLASEFDIKLTPVEDHPEGPTPMRLWVVDEEKQ